LDLAPIPQPTSTILGNRSREAVLVGDLVGALLGHAEEFGDLKRWRVLRGVSCPSRDSNSIFNYKLAFERQR
jgi:hypothetical protein